MKSRVGYAVAASAGLLILAGAGSFQVSRGWRAPGQNSVVLAGPDDEAEKRMRTKDAIVSEVLLGDKSLLAAAAAFRRLDDEGSSRWVRAPQRFPDAASDDEAYCRCVIANVSVMVAPKWGTFVTKDLREELDARLRNGTLHLDEADGTPSGVLD